MKHTNVNDHPQGFHNKFPKPSHIRLKFHTKYNHSSHNNHVDHMDFLPFDLEINKQSITLFILQKILFFKFNYFKVFKCSNKSLLDFISSSVHFLRSLYFLCSSKYNLFHLLHLSNKSLTNEINHIMFYNNPYILIIVGNFLKFL
jgi:hypothetical protein